MRLPRDLSGDDLTKALKTFGYKITKQTGSHMRLTTMMQGKHNITIPQHNPVRIGTLSAVLREVAEHLEISRDELVSRLFS